MKRNSSIAVCIACTLLASGFAAAGEAIDSLIGSWVSSDGSARQRYEPDLDGSWINTRMWFRTDASWQLVATGSLYRHSGKEGWQGISRATGMDGIELFETVLQPVAVDEFAVRNISYNADGTTMISEETWLFDGSDRFTYTVFVVEDGRKKPIYEGTWVRESSR